MGRDAKLEIRNVYDAAHSAAADALSLDVVHVCWRALDALPAEVQACYELLSSDERERATRYRVEGPRTGFILTRGTLRFLLGKYLQRAPQELAFRVTEFGKPFLQDACDLRFNVSHTEGMALLGFVREREIGVDVERIRPQPDARKLAERFFSLHERNALKDLSSGELQAAFFRCWSRKEAYIKARGEGLSLPLSEFDVSVATSSSRILLATRPDPAEAGRWVVRDLETSANYAAAVAFTNSTDA
jgi:4'-phosphopantetheinyl transferase